ncbi:hypothetical protein BOTBODRAFT_365883 [Botryobasidium botryosum FD-172 SS1]|uniref:Eukaryotic translation initiation factor 4E class I n=1 Tax=Botryobasidium botryosum (strain FD-172 SS1) TaxID=930990 RepID=A0A067MG56_BOTB1|nr:hypothetical protein BOTBODRAFT_365883 [Botryobasidium botryosum FD-172 SS1]
MATSTLPGPALQASQAALQSALSDPASKPPAELEPGEIDEGQEIEVPGGGVPKKELGDDDPRTVFEDPTAFNVKHPLYSSWTLWFDSPATKTRNGVPQTPLSSVTPSTPMTAAAAGWMDDIKKVISFDSVEEFWGCVASDFCFLSSLLCSGFLTCDANLVLNRLYNNIVPPSQLPQKANYYLFKENIIPAWEDPANKDGGKWSIQLPKDKNRANIDKMWLFTMLSAIGETFDPSLSNPSSPDSTPPPSLITGVIVSTRPQFYRVSIWTRLAPSSTPPTDTSHPDEVGEALRARVESIGKHFKMEVLGYGENQKLGGPLATEVEFQSHKDSEKKGKSSKKWIV